jgi:hypothetical protein
MATFITVTVTGHGENGKPGQRLINPDHIVQMYGPVGANNNLTLIELVVGGCLWIKEDPRQIQQWAAIEADKARQTAAGRKW